MSQFPHPGPPSPPGGGPNRPPVHFSRGTLNQMNLEQRLAREREQQRGYGNGVAAYPLMHPRLPTPGHTMTHLPPGLGPSNTQQPLPLRPTAPAFTNDYWRRSPPGHTMMHLPPGLTPPNTQQTLPVTHPAPRPHQSAWNSNAAPNLKTTATTGAYTAPSEWRPRALGHANPPETGTPSATTASLPSSTRNRPWAAPPPTPYPRHTGPSSQDWRSSSRVSGSVGSRSWRKANEQLFPLQVASRPQDASHAPDDSARGGQRASATTATTGRAPSLARRIAPEGSMPFGADPFSSYPPLGLSVDENTRRSNNLFLHGLLEAQYHESRVMPIAGPSNPPSSRTAAHPRENPVDYIKTPPGYNEAQLEDDYEMRLSALTSTPGNPRPHDDGSSPPSQAHVTSPSTEPSSDSHGWPSSTLSRGSHPPASTNSSVEAPRTINPPPGLPSIPANLPMPKIGTPINTTMSYGAGPPVEYWFLHLRRASPEGPGTYYLVAEIWDGYLWCGFYNGPYSYLEPYLRTGAAYVSNNCELGNGKMMPVSPCNLFPLYEENKMRKYHRNVDIIGVRQKWQDIFGPAQYDRRDECCIRLANEIAICERIQPTGFPWFHHPNLALYCGVVPHMIGDPKQWRVTSIMYKKYTATLEEFCRYLRLLTPLHVDPIMKDVERAVKHLHSLRIIHGQIGPKSIYLSYTVKTIEVNTDDTLDDPKGKVKQRMLDVKYKRFARLHHVVVGDFDLAKDHSATPENVMEFLEGQARDIRRAMWIRQWLGAVLRNPDMDFGEEEHEILRQIDAGGLNPQQVENTREWAEARLANSESALVRTDMSRVF